MITTVKGRITDVEGTIYTDEKNPKNSTVEATLKAASIDTRTDQRDQHLRSADFLNVEKYPEIKFRSTRIEGDKEQFQAYRAPHDSRRNQRQSLSTFSSRVRPRIRGVEARWVQRDWQDRSARLGTTWNQALEAGGVVVGNDIKINIEVEAVRAA